MRFLELAHQASLASTAKQQGMGAVVAKGGRVLSIGINLGWRHCETRALRPHLDLRGADIYVMRHNRRISRPCDVCQKKIIAAGIRRAFYIALDGSVVKETFKE